MADDTDALPQPEHDDIQVPVPDPGDDLSDLAVFADEDGSEPDAVVPAADAEVGYDAVTDLAVPGTEQHPGVAFAPFGGSVPDPIPQPGYDVDRDTGI